MHIFNSLGSNYDKSFVWRSIFTVGSKHSIEELRQDLTEYYDGSRAIVTYKGREALEEALNASGLPKDSLVGINGFTCYALYEAVLRAGFRAVLIDVAPGQFNFDVAQLEKIYRKNKLKAVVVQNTLGLVANVPAIDEFCKRKDIVLIEDLAHSLGAIYSDGREAGKVGQFTMLSFSQDKPMDVVAGGALVDRRTSSNLKQPKKRVSLWQTRLNAFYPFWTMLIRNLYSVGLGRYLHFGLKKLHLLATPMSDNVKGVFAMEGSRAKLLLEKWDAINQETRDRVSIAQIYQKTILKKIQIEVPEGHSLFLRFPILVDDPASLISYLKTKDIHIGDTWYDAPIGPKKYLSRTNYVDGQCPNSEDLSKHIVNLPTHINVDSDSAKIIAKRVNEWLKSQ
jgi:dTDP-4-amino-4,6-dideoxygalactose transaminase